jgi:hypothetical protein
MSGMSKVFAEYSSIVSTIIAPHTFVVVAEMGHQYSWTIDNYTRKLQVRSSGGRIFHKMDRGEASSQHSNSGVQEIFLAKHNMSFWSA